MTFLHSLYYRKRFYTAAEALAVIDDIPSGSEDERLSGEDSDDADDTFTPDANDAEESDESQSSDVDDDGDDDNGNHEGGDGDNQPSG